VQGGQVKKFQSWTFAESVERDDRWTVSELAEALGKLVTE
jgi:hypothetical protein